MNIKFILEGESTENYLSINDVDTGQFFTHINGNLCQKVIGARYNSIATSDGRVCANTEYLSDSYIVAKILPKVLKITWE